MVLNTGNIMQSCFISAKLLICYHIIYCMGITITKQACNYILTSHHQCYCHVHDKDRGKRQPREDGD